MSRFLRSAVFFLAVRASGFPEIPILIVRERVPLPATAVVNCEGRLSAGFRFSTIAFFDSGEVAQLAWTVPACSDPARARVWTPPAGTRVRRSKLQAGGREALQRLLDLSRVKALTDFMNAGPGVGDYQIEIRRASGMQKLSVLSLMPEHDQLRHDPALLRVICAAKEIAGSERPGWCAPWSLRLP